MATLLDYVLAKNRLAAVTEELAATTEKLDATAEKLDATAEKLDATAEELDATTEELAATTEKLDATAEKLDATAEELAATKRKLRDTADALLAKTDELLVRKDELSSAKSGVKALIVELNATKMELEKLYATKVELDKLYATELDATKTELTAKLNALERTNELLKSKLRLTGPETTSMALLYELAPMPKEDRLHRMFPPNEYARVMQLPTDVKRAAVAKTILAYIGRVHPDKFPENRFSEETRKLADELCTWLNDKRATVGLWVQ